MNAIPDWRKVYDFWFPAGLGADAARLREMFLWWFGGGSNVGLKPFAPLVADAEAGHLDGWSATPQGRLSLILVLDQFPRGLFAGSPEAYAGDAKALANAEEGLRNGQFRALVSDWEKTFFLMPLGHTEGPDHVERLTRVVAIAEEIARGAPEALKPIYLHSVSQARANLELIARFGRFPHRNAILGRSSTPEEQAYVEKGDFIHRRMPPAVWRARGQRGIGVCRVGARSRLVRPRQMRAMVGCFPGGLVMIGSHFPLCCRGIAQKLRRGAARAAHSVWRVADCSPNFCGRGGTGFRNAAYYLHERVVQPLCVRGDRRSRRPGLREGGRYGT